MVKIHCSLAYHVMPLDLVESFALKVEVGYYTHNPPFTVLTITQIVFHALVLEYVAKRAAYLDGGSAAKSQFLTAKTNLMAALDSLAEEVDKVANGDETIILLSGFTPTKQRTEGHVPGQVTEVTIDRGVSGELLPECGVVEGAEFYVCIIFEGGPMPANVTINSVGQFVALAGESGGSGGGGSEPKGGSVVIDYSKGRKKRFTNLTAGSVYYVYFIAVNNKGVGPISDERHLVCG